MTEAKAALTQLHKAAIVAELEKAIRLILDTRHTVPVDTPYSDSYAPRLAKFVANAVCEARIDELEGIKFGFSTRPTNMDFVLGIEKRIAELRGERE